MRISKESILTLSTFFISVAAFYLLGYWLIFRMGQATPLMMSVGMATILTCLIRRKSLANLGWGWGRWKYQWLSYLVPFSIAFLAYITIWTMGFGEFYNAEFLVDKKQSYNLGDWSEGSVFIFHIILVASISFLISLPSILGEEIGWRGLLVPELSKFMSFKGVALISGLVWSVWHWPLIILGLYGNDVAPLYYQLFFFTVFITSNGVIMAYIRLKSESVWTAVIYHASSNIFIQKVFTPITVQTPHSSYYVDEFGVVIAFTAFVAAAFFWRKGAREFDQPKSV